MRRKAVPEIHGIRFRPQMREHLVAGARGPLVPQRRDIDRGDDNPLSRTGRASASSRPSKSTIWLPPGHEYGG